MQHGARQSVLTDRLVRHNGWPTWKQGPGTESLQQSADASLGEDNKGMLQLLP